MIAPKSQALFGIRGLPLRAMSSIRVILTIILTATLGATASAKVVVKRQPIDVKYVTFDPAHPPAAMPHLSEHEAAVTVSSFRIQAELDHEVVDHKPSDAGQTATVDVHGLTIILKLQVIVYTPQGVSDKLKAHEEGHRKIAERIYQERAVPAAKAAGAILDGKRLTGDGPNWKQAASNAVNPPLSQMGQEYLAHTADISDEVNNTYDVLTAHGTNDKPEAQAIKEAFQKYIENHPTTRPAK